MKTLQEAVRIVRERLDYHFRNPDGNWNLPEGMPFMQEFLNEVGTLCKLCLEQNISMATTLESTLTPEMIEKINVRLHNLCQIDQHNELSTIFLEQQRHHEIDMQSWIDEWHACECNFPAWYAKLPVNMQSKVSCYYQKHFRETPEKDLLYCAECGRTDVQIMAWVKPNEGMMYADDVSTIDDEANNHCEFCDDHTELLTKEQMLEKVNDWWNMTDTGTREKITSISFARFDGGEIPAFEGACQAYWENLTDEEKIAEWQKLRK